MVKAARQADVPKWMVREDFKLSPPFQRARDQFRWVLDTLQAIQDTAEKQCPAPAIAEHAGSLVDHCVDLASRLTQLQARSWPDCCAKAELLRWMLDDDPDLTGALTASLCRDLQALAEAPDQGMATNVAVSEV